MWHSRLRFVRVSFVYTYSKLKLTTHFILWRETFLCDPNDSTFSTTVIGAEFPSGFKHRSSTGDSLYQYSNHKLFGLHRSQFTRHGQTFPCRTKGNLHVFGAHQPTFTRWKQKSWGISKKNQKNSTFCIHNKNNFHFCQIRCFDTTN